MKQIVKISIIALFFFGCKNNAYTPKPKGYPRISFPERNVSQYLLKECNYAFNLPEYAYVKPDPYPMPDECWYNIHFKPFNATLHLSYKKIKNRENLFKLLNDANTMVFKHAMRADEIVENYISKPGKNGIFFELDGSTATNAQFFITDSTTNFLRGSLYFNQKTNTDSIAPVIAFLKTDILQIINSLEWLNK